mmetsp:Transcript_28519/g.47919  ORF Transcript_28519/g.47919 Transcript_28519/m.47919 type:complete len:583 (+) Transcript_28519:164-1912(+)
MELPSILVLLYWIVCLLSKPQQSLCVWTKFDMIRPWRGAWGSNEFIPWIKIDSNSINAPPLEKGANFGYSVAVVGDLNQDGYDEIAVGAIGESVDYGNGTVIGSGGVYILFMADNFTIVSYVHINGDANEGGGPYLQENDRFGWSIAGIGDLDEDSVPDIAVGSPGTVLSSVYILYLTREGKVRDHTLIRGEYTTLGSNTSIPVTNSTNTDDDVEVWVPNGPPINYGSRFGFALACMGDMNGDGITEIAASALDASGGLSRIFLLYMQRNGSVASYTSIGPGFGGGPDIPESFTGYGSALLALPDFDGDNISELVVGARDMYDPGTENVKAGKVYFHFMNANGTARFVQDIGEWSLGTVEPLAMPAEPQDACGSSLAFIGDVNRDHYKQRHFRDISTDPVRPSIDDFLMGCPQTNSGSNPGMFYIMFVNKLGGLLGYTKIPALTDEGIGPPLTRLDRFAQSMAGYHDLDKNGLREIIAGAPGDDNNSADVFHDAGALYLIYLRRRRHHWIPFDWLSYYLSIFIPTGCFCCTCIGSIIFFFYYFRRRADIAEKIVKKTGYQMRTERSRYKKANSQVYADNYTL